MNIHEQLEKILADLGVEMDYAEREQPNEHSIPEVSIFQSSRDHYGVFYRLDSDSLFTFLPAIGRRLRR